MLMMTRIKNWFQVKKKLLATIFQAIRELWAVHKNPYVPDWAWTEGLRLMHMVVDESRGDYDIYSVVTALRGPDGYSAHRIGYYIKDRVTSRLRHIFFRDLNSHGLREYSPFHESFLDELKYIPNDEPLSLLEIESFEHFILHTQMALQVPMISKDPIWSGLAGDIDMALTTILDDMRKHYDDHHKPVIITPDA